MIFRPKGLRGLSPDRVRNHQAFRRISEAEESRYHQLNQSGLSDTFLPDLPKDIQASVSYSAGGFSLTCGGDSWVF